MKYNSSLDAMYFPAKKPALPDVSGVKTCCATMKSGLGFSKTPSLIMSEAPPGKFFFCRLKNEFGWCLQNHFHFIQNPERAKQC